MEDLLQQLTDQLFLLFHQEYEAELFKSNALDFDDIIVKTVELFKLCPEVLERLRRGELTAGHARAILSLKSDKKQMEAAQKICALGLSVRQAELICKNMTREPAPEKEVTLAVDYVAECEKSLSKHLGRGVKIVNGKRKGRFELEFYGQDDLQTLLDTLMQIKK